MNLGVNKMKGDKALRPVSLLHVVFTVNPEVIYVYRLNKHVKSCLRFFKTRLATQNATDSTINSLKCKLVSRFWLMLFTHAIRYFYLPHALPTLPLTRSFIGRLATLLFQPANLLAQPLFFLLLFLQCLFLISDNGILTNTIHAVFRVRGLSFGNHI